MSMKVRCYADGEAWVTGVAAEIVTRLRAAVAARRVATILLAGGNTPVEVYRQLARAERVDWNCVHFFWGDERSVPADHPDSNFRMARESLLDPLAIASDDSRVHRFPTEAAPGDNAAMYDQNLRLFFKVAQDEAPVFDIALLGMGDDGHTASLFPGTEGLTETKRLAVANPLPESDTIRLTVTFPLLNAARAVLMLVRGAGKAARLAEVLEGESGQYPVQSVRPLHGDLIWFVDRAAASALADRSLCEEL